MLDHLMEIEYDPPAFDMSAQNYVAVERVPPSALLDAQVKTADWLGNLGVVKDADQLTNAERAVAADAFTAMVLDPEKAKAKLLQLKVPEAVKQTVTLLSAYDWEFIHQAQQIRGMAVAKIIEETEHPDARIRLKALELLGKVTEVGLFTERIEIKKDKLSDAELDAKIKDRMQALSTLAAKINTPSNDVVDGELVLTPEESLVENAAAE